MQILKNLNDQQQKAVQEDRSVILTACPGSGKTRVLTHKIAYELTRNSDPRSWILGLTYTTRAADEISRRIDEMGLNTERVWIGTIHSFCLEWVLRPFAGCHDRLRNGFNIIDEVQADHLISDLKTKFDIGTFDKINTKINSDGSYAESRKAHLQVVAEYHDFLLNNKLIDFDLVLSVTAQLLSSSTSTIAKSLTSLFAWVCIDEYQDTQELQYKIVGDILRNGSGKYFVVGDPNQSIYFNLGATSKAFDEIEAIFGTSAIRLTLDKCYRSTQRIIDYYSNFQQASSKVTSHAPYASETGAITYNTYSNKDNYHLAIGAILERTLESGTSPSEICIVAPQWDLVSPCARKLREIYPQIKFDSVGKGSSSKHKFNVWYKITCLLLSQSSPRRTWYRWKLANEIKQDIENQIGGPLNEQFRDSRHLLNLLNSISSEKSGTTAFLEEAFGVFEERLRLPFTNGHPLKICQAIYLTSLKSQEAKELIPSSIAEFRSWFHDSEGVVISSYHGLKGEEYDTVIAFGLLKGKIPHWNEIINTPTVADSNARQLLYVLCSRAKRNLHLISEAGRTTPPPKNHPYEQTHLLKTLRYSYDSI